MIVKKANIQGVIISLIEVCFNFRGVSLTYGIRARDLEKTNRIIANTNDYDTAVEIYRRVVEAVKGNENY
jgi:hypothetical protein